MYFVVVFYVLEVIVDTKFFCNLTSFDALQISK